METVKTLAKLGMTLERKRAKGADARDRASLG